MQNWKNRKIRLLVAIRCLDVGGAEKQVLSFLKALDKGRFEVCLVTMYGGVMEENAKRIQGLTYINLEKGGRFDIIGFLSSYISTLNEFSPDVVYSHLGEMNIFSQVARVFAKKDTILHGRFIPPLSTIEAMALLSKWYFGFKKFCQSIRRR